MLCVASWRSRPREAPNRTTAILSPLTRALRHTGSILRSSPRAKSGAPSLGFLGVLDKRKCERGLDKLPNNPGEGVRVPDRGARSSNAPPPDIAYTSIEGGLKWTVIADRGPEGNSLLNRDLGARLQPALRHKEGSVAAA